MNLDAISNYLHSHLPLTAAMGITARSWDGQTLQLTAPLKPNINHADSAFGGSISTLGITCGWALLHLALEQRDISNRLLIQDSSTRYLRPIESELFATASLDPAEFATFCDTIKTRRKARIVITTQLLTNTLLAASHRGTYVAILY
jgi:thioesterase domain-containing protein